tara:strand:- start:1092 stop:1394 length:303 start_codon:yes stop_codon:yes gene_type:complete
MAVKTSKVRKLSPFNIFMKQELKRIKAATPNIPHMVAFKQAAKNWKGHPKKGDPSLTRKGRKDFVTHKGDKFYHRKGHRQTANRKGVKGKPYSKRKGSKK